MKPARARPSTKVFATYCILWIATGVAVDTLTHHHSGAHLLGVSLHWLYLIGGLIGLAVVLFVSQRHATRNASAGPRGPRSL